MSNHTILVFAALAATAGLTAAQSLTVFDGAGVIGEFSGPPDPTVCFYPTGPFLPFPPGPACGPGLVPVPAGGAGAPGGVTYDSVFDLIMVSDGGLVESYTPGGLFVDSWVMPGPVFGLGIDSAAGLLWATDGGALVYAVAIPPVGTCGAPVPFAVPPFPVPGLLGPPLSGIDWDPSSGSLWASDVAGAIYNFTPAGAAGPVSPVPFAAIPGPCWGLPPASYVRLACDKGSPFGPGHLYLTDGFLVAPILPGGPPAGPTFAFPGPAGAPCFPTPVPTIGIGYAAHGAVYGFGSDPDGLVPPVIGSLGASTTPGPGFGITLAGAVGTAPALLFLTATTTMPGYACPPFPALGVLSLLNPLQPVFFLGSTVTTAAGSGTIPVPIPAGLTAIGAELFVQWFVFKPAGPSPWQASDALSFRIALN